MNKEDKNKLKLDKALVVLSGMEDTLNKTLEQDPNKALKLAGVLKIIDIIKEQLK